MKPVLFDIHVYPLYCLILFLLVAAGVTVWLAWLRRKQLYTRDHLITGLAVAGMAAIFLLIINYVQHFRVNAYGAMLMVGFIIAIVISTRLARRREIPAERLLDLGLVILVCSILGARAMYMLLSKDAGNEPFINLQNVLREGVGGLSFHGGLLGGLLGVIVYVRLTKLSFWRVADCLAPGVAVGYAITRIGCFLNGCCYGKHSDLPWAVSFPEITASTGAVIRGAIPHVHPTQLYATLMGLAMLAILLLLSRGKSLHRAGRLFMVFLMLEGVERFVMELFREPDKHFSGFPTPAQYLCIALVVVGVIGWYILPKTPAIVEETAQTPPPESPKKAAAPKKKSTAQAK